MAEIASWNGHKWEVTPSMITSFSKLQIKGSMETEDKSGKKQKWVAFKNSKAAEISFNMTLSRLLGVEDVKKEVDSFLSDARSNTQDFFLLNGEKLFTCKFLLTDVTADTIVLSPSGVWISADLKFTFKQSTKMDASASESSENSSSGKHSGKKSGNSARQTSSSWNSDVYSGSSSHDNNTARSSASAANTRNSGLSYRTAQAYAAKIQGKSASASKKTTTKVTYIPLKKS